MKKIFIESEITNIANSARETYHEFIYCYKGSLRFTYNGRKFEMLENCCAIILNNKFVKELKPSDDLDCKVLYIEEGFMRQSGPSTPYTIQAMLSLYTNPVMQLNEREQDLCIALFRNFRLRLDAKEHTFYEDILRTSARMLMLDMLDFHARIHKADSTSVRSSSIMEKFIKMLENKEYRQNREVAYYAEKLCVVPKYLSEVSNKVSGFSASYWIARFTAQDISELLRAKEMTIAEITELFHFTSTSYFNRYVKRSLGSYPSELRK